MRKFLFAIILIHKSLKYLIAHQFSFRAFILRFLGFPVVIGLLLVSCRTNERQADISDIQLQLDIQRFERDLFQVKMDTLPEHVNYLNQKYGDFFELYTNGVINIGKPSRRGFLRYLQDFLTDPYMQKAYDRAEKLYPDVKREERLLTKAFKRYKYFFPGHPVPDIYTIISGFNESVIIDKEVLAIALDKYLGPKCEYYQRLRWPRYRVKKMHRKMIPSDCMRLWGQTEWMYNDSVDNTVANHMIYKGKILYYVTKVLPELPDSVHFRFTKDELQFCRNNEKRMWTFFVEHDKLFSTNEMDIRKYTRDAPFTKGFPRESPGRVANWLGYRIVQSYMENHPDITMNELMSNDEYRALLNQSKYDP